MGCSQSSKATSAGGGDRGTSYVQTINDKCPHIRLDHISGKRTLKVKGFNHTYDLGYVYVSQRGYYPNGMLDFSMFSFLCINLWISALNKANQDSYLICENFLSENSHFFGVFDGHGEYGDYCSHFAADQVRFQLYHKCR